VDDDIFFRPKWIEHALDFVDRERAMVGSSGRRFKSTVLDSAKWITSVDSFQTLHDTKVGVAGINEVDFIGHWWMWRTECTPMLWREKPATLFTGEDIEFNERSFSL